MNTGNMLSVNLYHFIIVDVKMSYVIGRVFYAINLILCYQVVPSIRMKMCFRDANVSGSSRFVLDLSLSCICKTNLSFNPTLKFINKFCFRKLYCRIELVFSLVLRKDMPQKCPINVSTFISIYVMIFQYFSFYQRKKHIAFYECITFSNILVI